LLLPLPDGSGVVLGLLSGYCGRAEALPRSDCVRPPCLLGLLLEPELRFEAMVVISWPTG
jgi:hypothetical protein